LRKKWNACVPGLTDADVDVALITDDDSVYYFTGFYDYLHMEFGRPTILAVSRDGGSLLMTPSTAVGVWLQNDSATQNGACRRWLCQCEKDFPGAGGGQFYPHRKWL
jgi:Xaa-Pro aminopeptidase